MKRLLWLAALLLLRGCEPTLCPAQNVEGQPIASQYGQFQLQGTAENSFVFSPATCQVSAGNKNFSALTQGVPLKIIQPGNTALNETVTAGLVNINVCSVQLSPAHNHLPPFYVTSGTGGLQEAINANAAGGSANTIVIDAGFYALGGTTGIITSVTGGSTNLGLVDITTTPYTWYAWSDGAYAKVSVGGGNPASPNGSLQKNSNGSFGAAVAGTDYQTPIANACTGGISCPLTGSTYNFSYSGSAGSGTVGTGNQYQDPTYPNAGSNTAVGALTNKYTVPTGLSSTQLNALFSGLSSSSVTIQNGDNATPFANPNFDGVQDLRETFPTSDWNVKESGAQCDLQGGFASVTEGSPTLTFTSGYAASASDVGKYIEMVYEVSGEPTRFDAEITGYTNSTTVTLSTNAPFTVSEYSVDVGHRDDAAIAAAFGQWTYRRPIAFPVGNCWSDTIQVYGQSFHGQSATTSLVTGLAGDDVFAGMDPSQGGYQGMSAGMQIHDMKWEFDPRINASQPWQDVNASGTVTQHAATYRPEGIFTVWANYPLGPGWIQGSGVNNTGATNGVAATTQNSAVVCIPSSETEPPAGQEIVFPYFTSVFTSTISSLTGSGCASGSNPLTMAAALPNTSGYTTAQSEWMAGTSVQTITQSNASGSYANAIPATGRTYPFYLRLANNINAPQTPNLVGTGSNVAPYGLVQIDGEQFSYFSDSSYPATTSSTYWIQITAGAQNGTSAAAHATGATIVPLNPFQPTWPWPVTPSINSGVTPANAAYFPAWDIGNAAWAQPVYNGVDWASNGALAFSDMHDIVMTTPDFGAGSGGGTEGGPNAFQQGNATAGMYIATSTFKSKFSNIKIVDPQFGIFEGTPSINVYGMWSSYPTANGSSWKNITIQSAGYDTEFIEAQNDTKEDFLTFCQNGGETGTSWPGQSLGDVGCGAGWTWGGTYDDKDGGGGSDNTASHFENWYIEAEDGSQSGFQPYFEINCGKCSYGSAFESGGGTTFIEGGDNAFAGSLIVGLAATPIINYGTSTTMRFVQSAGGGDVGNTYGAGELLNYAPNASVSGHTDGNAGPFGALAAGNNLAPVTGQTAEMFATGNDLSGAEYVSGNSAVIFPDQLPLGGWIFDDTAPVSHGYSACYGVSPGQGCASYQFNDNSRVAIGPDQKIAPGKYIVHYAFKGTAATTFYFELDAVNGGQGACSGGGSLLILNPSLTTSWVQGSAPIDFTSASTCDLQLVLHNSAAATTVEMAYLVFTPIATNSILPVNTPADNAPCIPGAFLGSDSSYIYICTASGTVKRAALSAY